MDVVLGAIKALIVLNETMHEIKIPTRTQSGKCYVLEFKEISHKEYMELMADEVEESF